MPSYVHSGGLTERINAYFAVLIITVFGAFMTLLIIHIINLNSTIIVSSDDTVIYSYSQG
jgi:hypothetical protein